MLRCQCLSVRLSVMEVYCGHRVQWIPDTFACLDRWSINWYRPRSVYSEAGRWTAWLAESDCSLLLGLQLTPPALCLPNKLEVNTGLILWGILSTIQADWPRRAYPKWWRVNYKTLTRSISRSSRDWGRLAMVYSVSAGHWQVTAGVTVQRDVCDWRCSYHRHNCRSRRQRHVTWWYYHSIGQHHHCD